MDGGRSKRWERQGGIRRNFLKKNSLSIHYQFHGQSVYNNTVNPLALPFGSNYHFFRDGIKPAWEDPKNANGGKWTISIPKSQRDTQIDSYWMNTVKRETGGEERRSNLLLLLQ